MKNIKRNTKSPFWYFFTLFTFFFGLIAYIIIKQGRKVARKKDYYPISKDKGVISKKNNVNSKPTRKLEEKLTERQRMIYKELQNRGKMLPKDLSKLLPEVSSRTIRRDMTKLVELDLANQKGATKSTYYTLVE